MSFADWPTFERDLSIKEPQKRKGDLVPYSFRSFNCLNHFLGSKYKTAQCTPIPTSR